MRLWRMWPVWIRTVTMCTVLVGTGWAQEEAMAPGLSLRAADPAVEPPARPEKPVAGRPLVAKALQDLQAHRYQDALAGFQAAIKAEPENKVARVNLAVVLMRLGRYQEAGAATAWLVDRYPKDPAVLNNAAWLYATAPDPAVRDSRRGILLARRALLDLPSNYHVWSTLAEVYYIAGQFDRSGKAAAEALRLAVAADARFEDLAEYRSQIQRANSLQQAFSLAE